MQDKLWADFSHIVLGIVKIVVVVKVVAFASSAKKIITFEPVLEVVQPHSGKFVIAVLNYIFYRVEGIVKLKKLSLRMGIVKAIHGNQVHVIEGEVFKLGSDKVILLCVSGDNISQIESIMNHCGTIEAETQKSHKNDDHHSLRFRL